VDEVNCLVHTVMFQAMSCAELYSKTIRHPVKFTSCGLVYKEVEGIGKEMIVFYINVSSMYNVIQENGLLRTHVDVPLR